MTDHELEAKLRRAVEHAVPDDLDGVLARCKDRKGIVIDMTENRNEAVVSRKNTRRFIPWAAAACLLLAVGVGVRWQMLNTVASVVSLDVNPSVELSVNSKEKVLAARAANSDGEQILDGMDLKGTQLNVAVNAIVGSLLKNGYVDELANSILITVEDDNAARGSALEQSLATEVDAILESASVHGAILSQTVNTGDAALQEKADSYGITLGKATLVQSMVDQNSQLTFEELAPLSVNELNLLASNPKNDPAAVTSTGSASDGAYIGVEKAKEAAFQHAGLSASEVTMGEADFDYEDGRMVYELEFYAGGVEYEYDVDAATGAIVKSSQEGKKGGSGSGSAQGSSQSSSGSSASAGSSQAAQSQGDIGADKAKEAAFRHAGVSASQVTDAVVEKDWDDGRLEYSVDFWVGNVEYDYEIDGSNGSVLKSEKETHASAASDTIGAEKAQSIALSQAGCSASQVYDLEVSAELDERIPHYEVSFKADGMEYEYKIGASDGKVLSQEKERD